MKKARWAVYCLKAAVKAEKYPPPTIHHKLFRFLYSSSVVNFRPVLRGLCNEYMSKRTSVDRADQVQLLATVTSVTLKGAILWGF